MPHSQIEAKSVWAWRWADTTVDIYALIVLHNLSGVRVVRFVSL